MKNINQEHAKAQFLLEKTLNILAEALQRKAIDQFEFCKKSIILISFAQHCDVVEQDEVEHLITQVAEIASGQYLRFGLEKNEDEDEGDEPISEGYDAQGYANN